MSIDSTQGWIFAFVGIVFWGLFASPMKAPKVVEAELHPLVFGFYMSISIAISSLFIIPFKTFEWTWYGLLGAVLWTTGNDCAMVAVGKVGLATAQCIWAGLICIVSFLWGVLGNEIWNGESCVLKSTPLAVLGLAVIVSGIISIVMVQSSTCGGMLPFEEPTVPEPSLYADLIGDNAEHTPAGHTPASHTPTGRKGMRKSASYSAMPAFSGSFHSSFAEEGEEFTADPEATEEKGFDYMGPVFALGTAIMAGSCLVPVNLNEKNGPEDARGIVYAVSFGISSFIVAVAFIVLHTMVSCTGTVERLKFSTDPWVVAPCLLSGLLWNVGNIMSDLVTLSPLGLTIGYPIMQLALIIAGLAGIIIFKEIVGCKRIVAFLIASSFTGLGAVVLGLYGACQTSDSGGSGSGSGSAFGSKVMNDASFGKFTWPGNIRL